MEFNRPVEAEFIAPAEQELVDTVVLATDQPQFVDISPVRNPGRLQTKLVMMGGLVASAALASCGGGDSETHISTPTFEPTVQAGQTIILVENTPTVITTKTPEATPTPIPEKILTSAEISEKVKLAINNLTDKDIVGQILGDIALGEITVNSTDPRTVSQTHNAYGTAGRALIQLACKYSDNESVADAVKSIKAFGVNFVKMGEDIGFFEKGSSVRTAYYSIPQDCKNKFLNPPVK